MKFAPVIVIAAGGSGQRIGGDKAQRLLGGVTLLDRARNWAMAQTDAVAVAVGVDSAVINSPGVTILPDRQADQGPISALVSAMRFAVAQGRDHVLLVGCDMPFLPADLVAQLTRRIGDAAVAIPESGGRWHLAAALWRCAPDALDAYLAGGKRSLHGFAEYQGRVERIGWPMVESASLDGDTAADPFFNVNTVEDLAAAETRVKTESR